MKTVTIYTTMTCPFCYKAKGLLKKKGIDFEEISVDLNSKLRAEMAEKAGKTSVQIGRASCRERVCQYV